MNEIRQLKFPENEFQIEKYVLYCYIIHTNGQIYVYMLLSNLLCLAKCFNTTIKDEDVYMMRKTV